MQVANLQELLGLVLAMTDLRRLVANLQELVFEAAALSRILAKHVLKHLLTLPMLPIYKAISVDQEAIIGGSTKPCIMTVTGLRGKIIGDYVVKVFKPSNIEQSLPTNKEVYGSILAKAFDFAVPKPALVKVGREITDQLNNSER